MPHNMTPPLGLPDSRSAASIGTDCPPEGTRPLAAFPPRRTAISKLPPIEDLVLLLVVMSFVAWSLAFAYRMTH